MDVIHPAHQQLSGSTGNYPTSLLSLHKAQPVPMPGILLFLYFPYYSVDWQQQQPMQSFHCSNWLSSCDAISIELVVLFDLIVKHTNKWLTTLRYFAIQMGWSIKMTSWRIIKVYCLVYRQRADIDSLLVWVDMFDFTHVILIDIEFNDGRCQFDPAKRIGSISTDSFHRSRLLGARQQEMDQGLMLYFVTGRSHSAI